MNLIDLFESENHRQGVQEGSGDTVYPNAQVIKSKNGQPVGEIYQDGDSWGCFHYRADRGSDGMDSREDAIEELKSIHQENKGKGPDYTIKGVAEGLPAHIKKSNIPPAMRSKLTMRDIEAERPKGAFRFRVGEKQFMDRSAAEEFARGTGQRVEPMMQEDGGRKPTPRIERVLKQLRIRHPQAQDDLEALIYDFQSQQRRDRTDIGRLDQENDQEEADIDRLEDTVNDILKQKGLTEGFSDEEAAQAIADFLAQGGQVQEIPGKMPRLSTRLRRMGSRHIGQGKERHAGQLAGRGANLNTKGGNKPVVAAEGQDAPGVKIKRSGPNEDPVR